MARVAIVTGGTRGIGEAISLALRDQGMTVAANYAGNDEKAREFTERTGIKAYKWDVGDYRRLPGRRAAGRERARAGRRARQQCRHHPRRHDEADDPPGLGRGDRRQSRRLLQHGQGGVRGDAERASSGGSSTSARSTARPASTARSITPPPSRASTASPRRWPRKARARASPSTRSRPAISTPRWSRRCPRTCSRRSSPGSRSAGSARPRRSRAASLFLCAEDGGFVTGSTLSINGGQHMY